MGLFDKLKSIASSGTATLVEKIGVAADSIFTNKEELLQAKAEFQKIVNEHEAKMLELQNRELELELKDMESARNREVNVLNIEHAPLINKIIQPLLAILTLGSCFLFWYQMLYADIPVAKQVQIAGITGALTTLSMGVIGYYFGSSTGSASKQKQIDKMMSN